MLGQSERKGSCVIVCHCHRVSDRKVARAVADGCASLRDLRRECGAGGGCGACIPVLRTLLPDTGAPTVPSLRETPHEAA